jgi:hypothetical protein
MRFASLTASYVGWKSTSRAASCRSRPSKKARACRPDKPLRYGKRYEKAGFGPLFLCPRIPLMDEPTEAVFRGSDVSRDGALPVKLPSAPTEKKCGISKEHYAWFSMPHVFSLPARKIRERLKPWEA